jgi:hypothetical protein
MKQAAKNRLSSLSGFPVKNSAMAGLATGNREGKPAERKQEVLTPQCIIDVCTQVWGKIQFDPCYHQDAITDPQFATCLAGLDVEWHSKAYVNPPYKDLKAWLKYGSTQPGEQIWLVPVRTHRGWWRAWRDELDVYVELNPIKFIGYDQYFPAPLMLGYRGEMEFEFCEAAFLLGSVYLKRVHD